MLPQRELKRQESAYYGNLPRTNSSQALRDHVEVVTKNKVDVKKNKGRPPMFLRPSNTDVSVLTRHPRENSSAVSLNIPDSGDDSSHLPNQQPHPDKAIMSIRNPSRNKWRVLCICLWEVVTGWSDAAPGALLPYIEKHYKINYTVVSMIWVATAVGYILVAFFSHKIQPWLGKRKSLIVGCVFSCGMYGIVASGGPFPLVVVGFFLGGIGLAIVSAQANVFLSKLEKSSKYLAFFHGSYGIGATLAPLAATAMVSAGVKWNYIYLINLSMMVVNAVNLWISFKHADVDLKPWDVDDHHGHELKPEDSYDSSRAGQREVSNSSSEEDNGENNIGLQDLGPRITPNQPPPPHHADKSEMLLALHNPITWIMSFWVFFYQGAEVSMGGWIVTFLLDYRDVSSNYGYVSSGFWGGLTIGRLFLTRPLHKYLGARRSVTVSSLLTIILVLLTWLVPNAIGAAVFISLAGTLIGPNYPLMMAYVTSGILPRKIQVVSITICTAFGSSGGAVFPFIVGLISENVGTYVVMPVFIALYSLMIVMWLSFPNIERQRKQGGSAHFNLWQRIW